MQKSPVATSAAANASVNASVLDGSSVASTPPTVAPMAVPSSRLLETVHEAVRVDCMTTRLVMVAQYGSGSPTRLAIPCDASAATVVRATCRRVMTAGAAFAVMVGGTSLMAVDDT